MNCPRCDASEPTGTLQQFGGVCPKGLLDFAEEQDAPAFPNLDIESLLGQGGMGVVYKARRSSASFWAAWRWAAGSPWPRSA